MYLRYVSLVLPFLLFNQNSALSISNEKPIIIVGAGPAGIAAATRLLENGIENILVLEAEPRIGGRIYSIEFGDTKVDMGAMWCHGQEGNIVWEKLVEMNLTDLVRSTEHAERFHVSSRKELGEEFDRKLTDIMNEILDSEHADENEYENTGVAFERMYNKSIIEEFGSDKDTLKIAQAATKWLEHITMSVEGCLSWYDSKMKTTYISAKGNQHLNWRGPGYKIFLDILMKKYPSRNNSLPIDDKILLNKEVTKISWDPSETINRVEISCSDKSSYIASHVIFTPSLGVLKERAELLFEPRLPERKMVAIKRIGMGAVMKIFVHYPRKWWKDEVGFNFIWTEDDRKNSKNEFPAGLILNDGESWITRLFSIEMLKENPNVLLVWVTGSVVLDLEIMDEDKLLSGIEFTMKKFLGHIYDVPKPDKVLRFKTSRRRKNIYEEVKSTFVTILGEGGSSTFHIYGAVKCESVSERLSNWYANPHFRGTYSFQSMSSTDNSIPDLLEPLINSNGSSVIQFAGEATSPHHFSTVQGAVESGYREADRLIAMYKYPLLIRYLSQ